MDIGENGGEAVALIWVMDIRSVKVSNTFHEPLHGFLEDYCRVVYFICCVMDCVAVLVCC